MIHGVINKFLGGIEQVGKKVDWNGLAEVLKKDKGD